MFRIVENFSHKVKPRQDTGMILTCECGILKEAGGSDRCPRCGDKMRKKKHIDDNN